MAAIPIALWLAVPTAFFALVFYSIKIVIDLVVELLVEAMEKVETLIFLRFSGVFPQFLSTFQMLIISGQSMDFKFDRKN